MGDFYNSIGEFYDKLRHHGFEPHGNAWIYRKHLDRSGWLDKLDPITARKVEGKEQYFEVRPVAEGRIR